MPNPTQKPLISPKLIKQRLLHRIKQHKNKEIKSATPPPCPSTNDNVSSSITDEFSKSMEYLQSISKQKQIEEKQKYETNKKRKLERKTVKHLGGGSGLMVHLDLPKELELEDFSPSFQSTPTSSNDPIPYGILKGGKKPTYRMWNKTHRQSVFSENTSNPTQPYPIQSSEPPLQPLQTPQKTEREQRLFELRQKLQRKQLAKQLANPQTSPVPDLAQTSPALVSPPLAITSALDTPPLVQTGIAIAPTIAPIGQAIAPTGQAIAPTGIAIAAPTGQAPEEPAMKKIATKHIITKTIRKKYTVGKSKAKNLVSVMIKDKGTQKKVMDVQRDLKKTTMDQIKKYLVEQNLIKMGSNAPNDILRKMYESAFMTGEIKNANADILLHNFSKEQV